MNKILNDRFKKMRERVFVDRSVYDKKTGKYDRLKKKFVLLDGEPANNTDGALIVKTYMIDKLFEHFDDTESKKFEKFLMRGHEMFFLLQEEALFLHYWKFDNEPYTEDKDNKVHINKSSIGMYLYKNYIDYRYYENREVDKAITSYSDKRVAISIYDLEEIGEYGVLFCVCKKGEVPVIVKVTDKELPTYLLYVCYNSTKISASFYTSVRILRKYFNFTDFGGNVFDIQLMHWLLFALDRIPSFDDVSYYYQHAHFKNGHDIVRKTCKGVCKTLNLVLANEVRECLTIRDVISKFIIRNRLINETKKINAVYEKVYQDKA